MGEQQRGKGKLLLLVVLGTFILVSLVFVFSKFGQKQVLPFPQPTPTSLISSRPKQCDLPNTGGVYSCPGGNFKVVSKLPGGGFTLMDGRGKEIIRCPVVAPQYVNEKCKNLSCSSENLCDVISTPIVSCGSCPQLAPPHPDFCKDGTIIPGENNECGCQMPPTCKRTVGQKVFCQKPRPEVCTQEQVMPPTYICGSDGRSYGNKCSACANPQVEWYVIQNEPCQ